MPTTPAEWPVTPLAPNLRVSATGKPRLPSDAILARINTQWETARNRHPDLYDGRVFCADTITDRQITGHWSEYRRVLTQMREPTLYSELGLRPLAVTALLLTSEGAVLGRRSDQAIYQPGLWQGVPAGSVESRYGEDEIDLRAQLLSEFEEELGLTRKDVSIGAPLLACEHPRTHIVDVAFAATTALDFTTIESRWQTSGNTEYTALRLIRPTDRDTTLSDPAILPTTKAMLRTTWT